MNGNSKWGARLINWPSAMHISAIALGLLAGAANAKPSPLSYVTGARVQYSNPQPIPRMSYQYQAQRRFSVNLHQGNAGWIFIAADETGKEQVLDVTLPAAFADEYAFDLRPRVSFFIGKHDFDFDGIPELMIGARSLGPKSNPADNSLSVNVFTLAGNDWVRVGNMDGNLIATGDPKAFIVGNRIRMPRGLRGIVLEWAYESGSFVKIR